MARPITTAFENATLADQVRLIVMAEIEFESGWERFWSGYGTLTWDGKTWAGVGDLGGFSAVTETGEIRATGLDLFLSGLHQSVVSATLAQARQGKPANAYVAALDLATGAIVADPWQLFPGRVDVPVIEDDPAAATSRITIKAENRMIDLDRPRMWRYTSEDQHLVDSADKGFDFVPALQEKVLKVGP